MLRVTVWFLVFAGVVAVESTFVVAEPTLLFHCKECPAVPVFVCNTCKTVLSLAQLFLQRVVAAHQILLNICDDILGKHHFICTVIVDTSAIYVEHTPSVKICKRLHLCQRNGPFDWVQFNFPDDMDADNARILEVLNDPTICPSNNTGKNDEMQRVRDYLNELNGTTLFANIVEHFPPFVAHQINNYFLAAEKATRLVKRIK